MLSTRSLRTARCPVALKACALAFLGGWGSPALAATPPTGVAQEARRGFFLDVNLGLFATLGGRDLATGASRLSSPEPYLQLGVGYDVLDRLSISAGFGLGASSSACFATVTSDGRCAASASELSGVADDFTLRFFMVALSYRHPLTERLSLLPRLHLGYVLADPEPRLGVRGGFAGGVALGLEYATPLDHFSVGLEIDWRLFVGPNLNAIALYPKIKYTF